MSDIPLAFLLIPYGIIMLLFFFFSIMSLINLLRYGTLNFMTLLVGLLFLLGSGLILSFSYNTARGIDWQQPLITFSRITELPF